MSSKRNTIAQVESVEVEQVESVETTPLTLEERVAYLEAQLAELLSKKARGTKELTEEQRELRNKLSRESKREKAAQLLGWDSWSQKIEALAAGYSKPQPYKEALAAKQAQEAVAQK